MESDADLRELESEVRSAVERLAGGGSVRVAGSVVTLARSGNEASIDASVLLGGWRVFSSLLRERKVNELAQRLIDATSPLPGALPETGTRSEAAAPAAQSPAAPEAPAQGPREAAPANLGLGTDDVKVVAREIQSGVRDVLASHGVAGVATVRGGQLELYAGGTRSSYDLGNLPVQWPLLPEEIRARKIGELARRLLAAHRAAGGDAAALGRRPARLVAIPLGGIVLAVLIGVFAWKLVTASGWGQSRPVATGPTPETEEQKQARRARGCEAARKRVFAGASVGPFEMDGWFAELWIATSRKDIELPNHPALTAIVEGGKLAASADPELAKLAGGTVEIAPGFAPDRADASPAWHAATVRFGGAYVGAYMDPALRPRFLALADRVAETIPVELGALYGRCAHLTYHDLGGWFRGSDAAASVAALLYGAGSFTEAPAVDRALLAKLEVKVAGGGELSAMRAAAGKMDHLALAALVGPQGGSVAKATSGAVTVTFPLGGGTRAISASRAVARKLGIGVGE